MELNNQYKEKNLNEPINNNSKLLSKITKNNQRQMISNFNTMEINNILNKNIFNIYKNNNTFSNDFNNFNNIISQIQNNNELNINNNYKNNFVFSLNQNFIENQINIIQYNNKINNIIPCLNQIKNKNFTNNIRINNFHSINNINNISSIYNNNIIINPQKMNISNLNNNINYYNSLNKINNIKNEKQIQNNLNSINIIQNNNIKNNMNNNNFIKDNLNNSFNNKTINSNSNENKLSKDNELGKNYTEDFMKFINTLSIPLVNFLCSSKGTLEIQKKLGKSNNECKMLLIQLLNKEGLPIIMKNTYGNYFFQQLIKGAEDIIISLIISYITTSFIEISKDSCGTFSIQALLNEISSIEDELEILNCIKNHEIEMAFNKNATYVLQKIVLLFPDIHRIYLNEIILNNFKELCLDCNGICLIKNFIKTNTLVNNKKRINEEIIKNFVILAESPFGNYGIQYLMENWNKTELNDIKKKIIENIYKLSIQQFSSNVVEKGIEIFDDESREKIIKKLCFEGNFIILLKNKFGRFVLNKAINYMKLNLKNEFEIYLLNNINNNSYCHKDKNKVKKFIMKINSNKHQTDFNFDLNKEIFVRKNMGKICNYNYDMKNNNNNY